MAKFFGTVDKLITFFRSSRKRTQHLGYNLPRPGDTRWLSCDTASSAIDEYHEAIGTVLREISSDRAEKIDTQTTARGLVISIQNVDFICLLKLYRTIFDHCTPITTIMQKPTVDAVQLKSMLDDFLRFLAQLNFNQVWEDTLEADPNFPITRARGGWRGVERSSNGSSEDWKRSLTTVAMKMSMAWLRQ